MKNSVSEHSFYIESDDDDDHQEEKQLDKPENEDGNDSDSSNYSNDDNNENDFPDSKPSSFNPPAWPQSYRYSYFFHFASFNRLS